MLAKKNNLSEINLLCMNRGLAEHKYKRYEAIIEGVFFAREMISEPANIIYPKSFAERCIELKKYDIEIEVLDVKAIEKNNMNEIGNLVCSLLNGLLKYQRSS